MIDHRPESEKVDFSDVLNLARETYERGNFETALDLVEEALAIDDTNGEARYLRRMINYKLGRDVEAPSRDNILYRCPQCSGTFDISKRMKESSGGVLNCPQCLSEGKMIPLKEDLTLL